MEETTMETYQERDLLSSSSSVPLQACKKNLLVSPAILQLLFGVVTAMVGFVLALRPFSGGMPAAEPETAFLFAILGSATLLWSMGKLCAIPVVWPSLRIGLPLAAFLFFLTLSVVRAWTDGNGQAAIDLAAAWISDLLLFLLVIDLGQDACRRRFFLACLLAGMGTLCVYALYQRCYGFEYFRHMLNMTPSLIPQTVGTAEVVQRAFAARVASDRITGPFGYPNAVAGYLLLLLPLLFSLFFSLPPHRRILKGVFGGWIFLGLLILTYTGSKAGFLVAKTIELAAFLLRCSPSRRPIFEILRLGVGIVLSTSISLSLAWGAYRLLEQYGATSFSWSNPSAEAAHLAQTLFAILWAMEIVVLGRWGRTQNPLDHARERHRAMQSLSSEKHPRRYFLAMGTCLVILFVFLVAIRSASITNDSLRNVATKIQKEAMRHIGVRGHYWIGAIKMILDHPWRGVGLDNFASRYSQYRTLQGWAVKRVHNHYLQLAADGGLPLLFSFLAIFFVLFRLFQKAQPPLSPDGQGVLRPCEAVIRAQVEKEISKREPRYLRLGGVICLFAFFTLYFFYLLGLYLGLSIEFFFKELWGSAESGSYFAREGRLLPMMIHGGVHFLLLPLTWLLSFYLVFSASREGEATWRPWFGLGIAALLAHAFFDFHLSITPISACFWAVVALALTLLPLSDDKNPRRLLFPPSRVARETLLLGFILMGTLLLWIGPLRHLQGSFLRRLSEVARNKLQSLPLEGRTPKALEEALEANRLARELRPRDPELWAEFAEILELAFSDEVSRLEKLGIPPTLLPSKTEMSLQRFSTFSQPIRERIEIAWKKRAAYDPWCAAAWAQLARRLRGLYPEREEKGLEALHAMEKAVALHPYRPAYHLELAAILVTVEKHEEAKREIETAYQLDRLVGDEQDFLTEKEKEMAEMLLQRIAKKKESS